MAEEAARHIGTSNVSSNGRGGVFNSEYFVEIIPNEKNGDYHPLARIRKNMKEEVLEPLEKTLARITNVPKSGSV
ncbi:hypothetical protein [Dyadobacter chenhuakuii]|uniref:Uncharacterized protein n=1 Tax=Dyadobacter chenhuakuii TaxID=2909339 RepID=A0A9X1QH78_9BACT|nr:hypothetical protein [Dyadobacter chenhuakuii]MCF2501036.1 hypothetical protein [Dyadobacter chenhuakuii]